MNYRSSCGGEAVFERLNKQTAETQDEIRTHLQQRADDKPDILDTNTELRLCNELAIADAEIITYLVTGSSDIRSPNTQATYRGIVFANMLVSEVTESEPAIFLSDYFESNLFQTYDAIQERILRDSSDYLYYNQDIDALLGNFMSELDPWGGNELCAEVGAAIVFRQAEIQRANEERFDRFSQQLEEIEKYV